MFDVGVGVLTRDTVLYNDVFDVVVPKGTIVVMFWRDGVPTVEFKGLNIVCRKIDGKWFAEVYGQMLVLKFPKGGECYPFTYFKNT